MALRTVTAEDEGLGAAIAETEHEIFSEANGKEPIEGDGDKSLEQMGDDLEGRTVEDDGEAEEEETEELEAGEAEGDEEIEADGDGEEAESEQAEGRVPSRRLREEADRRREAQAEATRLREQIAELTGRINQISQTQKPKEQTEQPEVPDMFSDPEGWQRHLTNQITAQFETKRVEASLQDAADEHGEKFTKAYADLQAFGRQEMAQTGRNSPTVARIWGSPNPGKALISWHNQQSALKEIGGDLDSYREKLKEELLNDPSVVEAVISRARGTAQSNGRSNGAGRQPPSLNRTAGGRHTVADPDMLNNSERSVFDFATR